MGNTECRLFRVGTIPEVSLEFGTVLVEGYSMPEGADNSIGSRKGKTFWDESDGVDGIPERL